MRLTTIRGRFFDDNGLPALFCSLGSLNLHRNRRTLSSKSLQGSSGVAISIEVGLCRLCIDFLSGVNEHIHVPCRSCHVPMRPVKGNEILGLRDQ